MNELKNWEDLSEEERSEVTKALSKSRLNFLFSAIKFLLGLFIANTLTLLLGHYFTVDANPTAWLWFCLTTSVTNGIFLSRYFTSQMDKNNDILTSKIKEILKK